MNEFNNYEYKKFFSKYYYSPSNFTLSSTKIGENFFDVLSNKYYIDMDEYCIGRGNKMWFEIDNLDLIIKPQQEVKAEENNSIEKLFNKL